jgi:hypothetical protein
MIRTRIAGRLVSCGRPGCGEPIGDLIGPRHVRLRGQGWHVDEAATPARWRRAKRLRGGAKAEVRNVWGPYLPGGPTGYEVTYRAVAECPRCNAVQRIEE